ncbi:MAG: A/G-specific adenine glycosylase [Bacteroidota bacterium]
MTHSSIHNRKSAITKSILSWYRKNARPLPWRKTRNPYRILVSEVMLQQTQVNRVLQKYPEFLRWFPNFSSLAHARTADVIRAWAGMGYNNRAVRLQQIAKEIMNDNNGRLPSDIHILQKLPGIGRYTAHAVACFSFGQHTAVVDTNVRRILVRLFPKRARSLDEWELAESILPKRKAYEWNQALMELGSTLCTAAHPRCVDCPLKQYCPSAFQIRKPKKSYTRKNHRAMIPNRIYRGRIVALLRTMSRRQSIESNRLLHMIRPEAKSQNHKWFSLVLTGLQRDGLIQIHSQKAKSFISLPK